MQIKDLMPWSRRETAISRPEQQDNPMATLQREINRIFDNFWSKVEGANGAGDVAVGVGTPRADVVETETAVEISIELPGMDEKDVEVAVTDDVLTIKGEKKAEREDTAKGYYVAERSYGSFYRAMPLPAGVATDDAKATFEKGVLKITLAKTPEAQAKVKRIEVEAA
jgi:HSP20 family protein